MDHLTDIVGNLGSYCDLGWESTYHSPNAHLRFEFWYSRIDVLGLVGSWHDSLCVRDFSLRYALGRTQSGDCIDDQVCINLKSSRLLPSTAISLSHKPEEKYAMG